MTDHVTVTSRTIVYSVNRGAGYSNPDERWRAECSTCEWTFEDRDRKLAQQEADAHQKGCEAGWSVAPLAGRATLDARFVATKDDRTRWASRRRAVKA